MYVLTHSKSHKFVIVYFYIVSNLNCLSVTVHEILLDDRWTDSGELAKGAFFSFGRTLKS